MGKQAVMVPEVTREDGRAKQAIIPYVPFPDAAFVRADCDMKIVFLHQRNGPSAEQFRRLATRMVNHHPVGGTVMVTSPAPEDGKTLTAVNLALCLAERAPVLLVDLDTRRSTLRHKLGLPPVKVGIEDVLAENQPPESCVLAIPGTKLCVAMNKGKGRDVLDMMAVGRPKRFFDWAQRMFEWVILDTPPVFPIADTLEIANHVSIGMLIVRARRTPAPLVKLTIDALKGRIQYVVLNDSESLSYSEYDPNYYSKSDDEDRRRR
jgi:Mrp family chromosome partitioning ATPase